MFALSRLLFGSLQRQFMTGMVVTISFVVVAFMTVTISQQQVSSMERYQHQLVALTHQTAMSASAWLSTRDYAAVQEMMATYVEYPDLVHAMVLDVRGQVVAHSQPVYVGKYILDLPTTDQPHISSYQNLVESFYPVMQQEKRIGWVRVGLSRQSLMAEVASIHRNGLMFGLLGLLLSVLLAKSISHYFVRRLIHIQQVADAVEKGFKSQRAQLSGTDEAAMLAQQFNRMLTSLQQGEQSLLDSEARFRDMMMNMPLPLAYVTLGGDIVLFNHRFESVLGYQAKDVPTLNEWYLRAYPDELEREHARHRWDAKVKDALETRRDIAPTEFEILCGDGVKRVFMVSAEVLKQSLLIAFVDVTERVLYEQEIHDLAYSDMLTGLPNRVQLLQDLESLKHRIDQLRYVLLFLDLDYFKMLNDTLGHAMGDLLLKQVGKRLQAEVDGSATVYRLGGDEFVILFDGLLLSSADMLAQEMPTVYRILAALNKPFELQHHLYQSSTSIGMVVFDAFDVSSDTLLKQADIAMYQAKKTGRNQICLFDRSMQEGLDQRVVLERDLALSIQHQQLILYYQLQVSSDNQPIGAETLIRWHHPEKGFISPSVFIPIAEERGWIVDIGRWVLERACEQLQQWAKNALTSQLTLSVNVSAKQFFQVNFVEEVTSIVGRYDINPKLLKLELTESVLLDRVQGIVETMKALKQIGISFSLDDFGTGYSSLRYLKQLPLYQLKIDQSFVRDLESDHNDKIIVQTIIAMAKALNLHVIAEGVETQAQKEMLKADGCEAYQGYLFAQPLPVAAFEALLARWQ